jgi:hypothetical protein
MIQKIKDDVLEKYFKLKVRTSKDPLTTRSKTL